MAKEIITSYRNLFADAVVKIGGGLGIALSMIFTIMSPVWWLSETDAVLFADFITVPAIVSTVTVVMWWMCRRDNWPWPYMVVKNG